MPKSEKTFLVLDGNALLHRAWHALPPLTTKDGTVVNAAYGFAMIVEKMIEAYGPDYMAVAWDLPGDTFRHEAYEDYKATREEKEQELYDQIPIIQEILEAYGIPSLSAEGYEADDVIGTLAKKAAKNGYETLIVTGDLDALQLVTDKTRVLFFIKGISEVKEYDPAAVKERYGLSPEQLIDYKALRGDPSDNIPGVAGVGDKTATELLKEHGTIEGIYEAIGTGEVAEKYAKKFRGAEEEVEQGKHLVTIVRDVPVAFSFAKAKVGSPDTKKLVALFRNLEFRTLLRKYGDTPAPSDSPSGRGRDSGPSPAPKGESRGVQVMRGAAKVAEALKGMDGAIGVLAAEQQADLFGATLAAVAVTDGERTIVVANPAPETMKILHDRMSRAERVIVHGAKKLMHATDWMLDARAFDMMIASYLLHPGSRSHDIVSIIHEEVHDDLAQALPAMPEQFGTDAAHAALGEIAQAMIPAADALADGLQEAGMEQVFWDIEIPLVPVLYKMEKAGIEIDTDALGAFSKKLKKQLSSLTDRIHELAGEEFNINSPSQLAAILFETLALPTKGIKKTKSGYSTAASELEKLADAHEIVPLISEYRELEKLRSTYADALPELVGPQGRIHTTFNQVITSTGRLSSSQPNLQNIPIKSELGKEIRKAFVAGKGKTLIAADYSQVELRLAAVIAGDKPFIKAFQEGADIHTRTASEVWEVPEDEVTPEQRYAAKAINFGILYGMGPRALARSTGMKFAEAQDFIDRYFQIHHAIRDYLDETKALAHSQGYVETLFGRRRYFPEIESGVAPLVAAAERMAINMPIQGTAADLMKKAMIALNGWLQTSQWPARMLLQVHDEVVLECKADAAGKVAAGMKEMMEGVADFDVPLAVEVDIGPNWGEMREWQEE